MQCDDFKTKLKILGENVRKLRTDKNLSLKKLSLKSGISIKYLKIIEDGRAVRIRLDHFDRLCYSFGLNSLSELLLF